MRIIRGKNTRSSKTTGKRKDSKNEKHDNASELSLRRSGGKKEGGRVSVKGGG